MKQDVGDIDLPELFGFGFAVHPIFQLTTNHDEAIPKVDVRPLKTGQLTGSQSCVEKGQHHDIVLIAAATQSNGNDSAVPLARLILNSLSRPNGIDCVHGTDEDFSVAMLAGFCSRLNRSNGAIEL